MHLVISYKGFTNASWSFISDDIIITEQPGELEKLCATDTLWILSLREDWLEILKKAAAKECNVVVMFALPDKFEMEQALANGASAYCPAIADKNTVLAIKQAVASESIWIPAKYLSYLTSSASRLVNPNSLSKQEFSHMGLSTRESEVVHLILQGQTNAEIATALFVAERTVKEHLTKIFKKLNVKDRLQLALLVLKS